MSQRGSRKRSSGPSAPVRHFPTSSMELTISCSNLLDKDVFSRSDPMCVVYHQHFGKPEWVELMRTETIWDCLNPDFATKVEIDYRFQEKQHLKFEVYDIDSESSDLKSHDFLGSAEITLGQIVAAGFNGLMIPLIQEENPKKNKKNELARTQSNVSAASGSSNSKKKNRSTITILAEEMSKLDDEVRMSIECHNLAGNDLMSMLLFQKTFLVVSKKSKSGKFTVIYKSEGVTGKNSVWKPMVVPMNRLCGGDKDLPLQFHCFREGLHGYNTDLGILTYTFNEILAEVGNVEGGTYLMGKDGLERKNRRLVFRECKWMPPSDTFVEYILAGTQILCCFGIDFSSVPEGSGVNNQDESLHYFSEDGVIGSNPYEQAIQALGEIIQDYKQSTQFPVFGFGARMPWSGVVSQNFFVNFGQSPMCEGIAGVMEAYKNCCQKVQPGGISHFAPIINDMAETARQNMTGQLYYVLLIISDGIIDDMPATKEAIVNASTLPLSIIIIGVGNANFDAMTELDGDHVRVSYCGRSAARDIVQFVPYRDAHTWLKTSNTIKMEDDIDSLNLSETELAKMKLAQEVLAEVPGQLSSFMKSQTIAPMVQSSKTARAKKNTFRSKWFKF